MNRRRSVPARWRRVVALALGVVAASAGRAYAWEPFRSANANVEAGNAALAKGDTAGALTAYDRAARQLPNEAGVHFDRGLALLKKGDTAKAREAFLLATDPTASAEIRAGAYHALGLGFYAEGDALAKENKHVE
ncbi:MAG: tetratricopeptide repeat protein, partial [Myxococcales bacterium]|nr:tetratricopeptide repeat protein [Myxococcales bacterium]